MLWNTVLLALRSIQRNLLRSFLTILGIVIGVSAVITMVTIGNGATIAVQNQISSLGTNLLMVRPGQRLGPGGGTGAPDFVEADAEAIASEIGGIRAVAPEARSGTTVVANGKNWSTTVTGTNNDWFDASGWTFAAGRAFTAAELQTGAAVCIIGATLRRELFDNRVPLDEHLRVKQFTCTIVGVLESKGQAAMGNDQDDVVVVPLRTLQRRVTGNRRIGTIVVALESDSDSSYAQSNIGQLLRERRDLAANEDDNFNILDTRQLAATLSSTTQIMTLLLGAVAAVSLLVGGIGIMNIMLVSVTERTREIGLRLAIGAREHEVLLQFLIEAVVLSTLGGIVGIVLATAASFGISLLMNVPYAFSLPVNLLSFVFSAAIGVFFGYFPSRRAARLDPIEALRHE
jgi:putative ABC transport system permease protein